MSDNSRYLQAMSTRSGLVPTPSATFDVTFGKSPHGMLGFDTAPTQTANP